MDHFSFIRFLCKQWKAVGVSCNAVNRTKVCLSLFVYFLVFKKTSQFDSKAKECSRCLVSKLKRLVRRHHQTIIVKDLSWSDHFRKKTNKKNKKRPDVKPGISLIEQPEIGLKMQQIWETPLWKRLEFMWVHRWYERDCRQQVFVPCDLAFFLLSQIVSSNSHFSGLEAIRDFIGQLPQIMPFFFRLSSASLLTSTLYEPEFGAAVNSDTATIALCTGYCPRSLWRRRLLVWAQITMADRAELHIEVEQVTQTVVRVSGQEVVSLVVGIL